MLRLQNERMSGALLPSAGEFFKSYGLTPEKLALAKPDAIVMHPGPINRGVEIDSAVADGAQSVILPQVTFGIAVRMAVMTHHRGERRHEDPHPERPRHRPGHRAATRSADVAIAAGRIVAHRQGAGRLRRRTARSTPRGLVVAPGPGGPGGAPARARATNTRACWKARCTRRRPAASPAWSARPTPTRALDEPGLVEMLKFRARKLSRCRALPAGRADARPAGRGADRDGRAHRGRLRRLLAGRRGRRRHPGAAARAAVRRHLRLHRVAAAAGRLAGQGRGRQRRGGHAAGPVGRAGGGRDRSRCTPSSSWCASPARACTCAACRSAAGVALLRAAKAEGLPVTADVSINSLHLTDVDIGYFNADMRLTPPLRQQRDRDALRAGAGRRHASTRWCPTTRRWTTTPRTLPFGEAEPGATGLELLLSLALKWGAGQRPGAGRGAGARHQRPGARARRRAGLAGGQRRPPGRRRRGRRLRVRPRQPTWAVDARRAGAARASTRRSPSPAPAWRCRAACAPRWWPARVAYEAARAGGLMRSRCAPRWRLLRAVLHLLHGMAVMALRFPSLDAAGRQRAHPLVVGQAAARGWAAAAGAAARRGPAPRCWWPTTSRGSTSRPSMRWRRRRASSPRPTC